MLDDDVAGWAVYVGRRHEVKLHTSSYFPYRCGKDSVLLNKYQPILFSEGPLGGDV